VLEAERLRRIMEVGRGLVSNLELEVVLNRLVEVARELTGARYAALGILDEERQELERFITVGIDAQQRAAIGDLPHGRGVLGELIRDPKPLRLENVGNHPSSYGFPASHPRMETFLGVPVLIRGEAYGNLYLTEKQGGPFDEADEEATLILADFAAIAIENARLYSQAESRRRELERAVRRLEATTEIARTLDGDMDLTRTLELIAKRSRASVDARWLTIVLAEGRDLHIAAVAGELDGARVGKRLDRAGTVVDEVMRQRAPRFVAPSAALADALGDASISSGQAFQIPLMFRGNAYGALVASEDCSDGSRLGADDRRLLEALAAAGASSIHTSRTVAAERLRHSIAASERERRRWARELHDETLQGLGGLQMLLSSALRSSRGDTELAEAVRKAVEQLTAEIGALRALITELRPAALDQLGLVPAIETLAQRTASQHNLTVETNIELGFESRDLLEPDTESSLYRLTQEALTNVIKHAAASRVEIALEHRDDAVQLRVSDDGRGFEPQHDNGGFGLIGMRERVSLAGGRLDIRSSPGEGTTLEARLPAPSPDRAAAESVGR